MRNWMKWMAPVAGLVLLAGFNQARSFGDDAPATQPTGTATIVVTVVDKDGKGVEGAQVSLTAGKHSKADAGEKKSKAALAQAVSDSDGKVSFPNIADGSYGVAAKMKGTGAGKSKVSVTDGANAEVSITLVPKQAAAPAPAAGGDAAPATPAPSDAK